MHNQPQIWYHLNACRQIGSSKTYRSDDLLFTKLGKPENSKRYFPIKYAPELHEYLDSGCGFNLALRICICLICDGIQKGHEIHIESVKHGFWPKIAHETVAFNLFLALLWDQTTDYRDDAFLIFSMISSSIIVFTIVIIYILNIRLYKIRHPSNVPSK